jgi:hypothetical protein
MPWVGFEPTIPASERAKTEVKYLKVQKSEIDKIMYGEFHDCYS